MRVYSLILTLSVASVSTAFAQEADYFKYLGIAQKFTQERKMKGLRTPDRGAGAIAVLGLGERFYKTGDSWSVAFTPSAGPDSAASVKRSPIYFDYKVTSVDERKLATIEVRQRLNEKDVPVDARIDYMGLLVNSQFVTLRKEIHFKDGRAPSAVPTNGRENISSGFSAYPIDLPALSGDEGQHLKNVPDELKNVRGFDAKRALDFESSDLYARPVRSIWRDGDVWPVYVSTPAGVSVLVTEASR